MRTTFDLTNAKALVDDYIQTLSDPEKIPARCNRTWVEFALERHGIIPDVRGLAFMESHSLWYACLIVTGAVRKVSRLESKILHPLPGQTTENTIRRIRNGTLRGGIVDRCLSEILERTSTPTV